MSNTNDCPTSTCPIQFVVDILGSKWSILILRDLWEQDRRTNELLKALSGISSKTLTVRLRSLEEHGLVIRRTYAEVPPRVEYAITDKGKELQPVITALHQVGQQWLEQDGCACPLTADTMTNTVTERVHVMG
ncbi:MAG: helix-turn-helix transcriptional regulator [Leptolyngbya sp. SIO3F4]|nr:helix-turn-helix transcriptional regulator [Leptolyngbya sp. SIO3F4]